MNLIITPEEREELCYLVEKDLSETRVEKRRTDTPGFREKLNHEESVLHSLLRKLKESE